MGKVGGKPMQLYRKKKDSDHNPWENGSEFFGMGNSFLSSRRYWCICTQKAMKDSGMRRTLPTSRAISTFVFFSCGFARQ